MICKGNTEATETIQPKTEMKRYEYPDINQLGEVAAFFEHR